MNIRIRYVILITLIVIIIFAFINVFQKQSHTLIGTWKNETITSGYKNIDIFNFNDNGTGYLSYYSGYENETQINPFNYTIIDNTYLFSWDEIPGNDSERLREFLTSRYGNEWIKIAKIEKIEDDKTIRVTTEKNYLSLKLNNEKININLEIDDGRTDEFIVKKENGKLNIYDNTYVNLKFASESTQIPYKIINYNTISLYVPSDEIIIFKRI